MDIKDYLKQVRRIDKEISSNIDLIERLRAKEHSCTSVLTDEPRNDSVSDKTKITDKRIDLENRISQDSIRLYELIDEAKTIIGKLHDTTKRSILTEYYINNKSWEEVAIIMGYCYMHIQRLHGQSLEELRKML
ncbi:MAG: hypothetical protein PHQ32_02465 [Firmicutes bacterium]|nr:hypothetical protein [Bacillota bacterium]